MNAASQARESEAPQVNLHAVIERSRANGPGERTVIWFQGCPLACPGCFNPKTHSMGPHLVVPVAELVEDITSRKTIVGISVTGGEPFAQAQALAQLLAGVRRRSDLSVIVFTGYTMKELGRLPGASEALGHIDVLIAGRYVARQRVARGLLGSANQRIHLLSKRYCHEDLQSVPPAEVSIDREGRVLLTGIDLPM